MNEPEDYELKLEQYVKDMRRELAAVRQDIVHHIRLNFHMTLNQKYYRRLSWAHQQLYDNDPEYRDTADLILRGYELPLHLASNSQDAYHHTHFIGASLLTIIKPDYPITELPLYGSILIRYADVGLEQEETRLEIQTSVYYRLREKLQGVKPKHKRSELEERVLSLERKVKEIQQKVDSNTGAGHAADSRGKKRKPKGD